MNRRCSSVVSSAIVGLGGSTVADTINVPRDYSTIQAAIDAAKNGDEVVVAPGVYFESIDFSGKAITLQGTGATVTTIDGGYLDSVVRCETGEGPDTVLDGFTITGGWGFGHDGGGMRNIGSSPTVRDCTFVANYSSDAGAMNNAGGSPRIVNCVFRGNIAGHGGGAMKNDHASVTVIGCVFEGNTAIEYPGGAIWNIARSDVTVLGCIFAGNFSGDVGGAIANQVSSNSTLNLVDSVLVGNSGHSGGAIFGACETIANCTIVANRNYSMHAGAAVHGTEFTVLDSIVWGNEALGQISAPATVRFSDVQGGWSGHGSGNTDSDPLFLAEPNDGGDGFGDNPYTSGVDEGLNDFFGDLRLLPGSPAIDAGHNWGVPPDAFDIDDDGDTQELLPLDLDANPRFSADASDVDAGCGVPVVVDMGAYEVQFAPVKEIRLGDLEGNGTVGITDLLGLLGSWGADAGECVLADLDLDGEVGGLDLLLLLGSWG